MIGLGIILAHLIADYVLQNDWMAREKTKRGLVALWHGIVHGLVYTAMLALAGAGAGADPFGIMLAISTIIITHAVIDRFRLAKHLIWGLNQLAPRADRYSWREARENGGYAADKPAWMSTWLMIIVDNTLHLTINTAAIVLLVL